MVWSVKSHTGTSGVLTGLLSPALGINSSFGCRIGTELFAMWGWVCQGCVWLRVYQLLHPDTEVTAGDRATGPAAVPGGAVLKEKGL